MGFHWGLAGGYKEQIGNWHTNFSLVSIGNKYVKIIPVGKVAFGKYRWT